MRARLSLLRARARRELGRYTEATRDGRTALLLGRHLGGMFLAQVHNELGVISKFSVWFAAAQQHYDAAMPLVRAIHGPRSREMAVLWHNLGGLAHARGDFANGERLARRAVDLLPRRDPERLEHEVAHAALLDGLGRHQEAIAVYRRALRAYRRRFGPQHVEIALALHNLAASEDALGRFGLARRHYALALAMQRRVLGVSHPLRLLTARNLASLEARRES
ncbi:MAG: tetratricopeptide repeat protein [Polyangiaceae bacterium]